MTDHGSDVEKALRVKGRADQKAGMPPAFFSVSAFQKRTFLKHTCGRMIGIRFFEKTLDSWMPVNMIQKRSFLERPRTPRTPAVE